MVKANDSGQSLVETALSLLCFLFLVMGIIDFGYMTYAKATLQNAVRQAGRYAITGQCITGSGGTCSESRYNSIIQTLQNFSNGLLTSSNTATDVTISCINQGGGCPNNAGGPGDVVTISVNYPYPLLTSLIAKFFPGGSYTIQVSAAFTNEHFPPSQS